jgi:hypothetical protein
MRENVILARRGENSKGESNLFPHFSNKGSMHNGTARMRCGILEEA